MFRRPYIFHGFNIWLNITCPGGVHEHGPSCLRIRQPALERGQHHLEFNIHKTNARFVSTGTPFLKSRQLAGAMPHFNSSNIKACPSKIQRIPATDRSLKMSAHQNVGPPKTEFPSRRNVVSVLNLKIIGFLRRRQKQLDTEIRPKRNWGVRGPTHESVFASTGARVLKD